MNLGRAGAKLSMRNAVRNTLSISSIGRITCTQSWPALCPGWKTATFPAGIVSGWPVLGFLLCRSGCGFTLKAPEAANMHVLSFCKSVAGPGKYRIDDLFGFLFVRSVLLSASCSTRWAVVITETYPDTATAFA
jgi:hypothetical protein